MSLHEMRDASVIPNLLDLARSMSSSAQLAVGPGAGDNSSAAIGSCVGDDGVDFKALVGSCVGDDGAAVPSILGACVGDGGGGDGGGGVPPVSA